MNLNRGLTVSCGGENLRFLGRDGGVAVDNLCRNAAHGLDTEGKRSYVKEKKSLYVAAEYAALNCSTDSYTFVGVNALERFFADKVLNGFLNGLITYTPGLFSLRILSHPRRISGNHIIGLMKNGCRVQEITP